MTEWTYKQRLQVGDLIEEYGAEVELAEEVVLLRELDFWLGYVLLSGDLEDSNPVTQALRLSYHRYQQFKNQRAES
jgi:hypothetical protein